MLGDGDSDFWGQIRKILINPECIDIWHGAFLGQGDSSLFK